MTFIGNTLGLSKANCENEPGSGSDITDSIGAFTTVNPAQMVNSYATIPGSMTGGPAGTTLDWTMNGSSAVLTIPSSAMILYAELIWSGSFGYYCDDPTSGNPIGVLPDCVLNFANGPINFTTPDGALHFVNADPLTAMESLNPATDVTPFYCGGNYTRSANVTALLTALGTNFNGTYIVGGVPATVSALDNTHNAAGWTLAIVYQDNSSLLVNNMSLFVGAQQGSRSAEVTPATVTGFCAQSGMGMKSARLLVSAIEGDANKTGDHMQFGPMPTMLQDLMGPNNPINNFFCSQINDDSGNLISTTGTFCVFNADPNTGTLVPNGRQGYDITNVDCSATIMPGQTTAYALGTVGAGGDDYMINAIGIQISVDAPVIVPMKLVNGTTMIDANIGDTVLFTVSITNSGTLDASDVVFFDNLETNLMYVPGTLTVNGSMVVGDPTVGVPLGLIPNSGPGSTVTVEFSVKIVGPPLFDDTFENFGTASFGYSACTEPIVALNDSNVVLITVASLVMPGPSHFNGVVKKCPFLNKDMFALEATWEPTPLPTVLSYEIFKNGKLEATIPSTGPFVFETCLHSKKEAKEFTIVAVYPGGSKSIPLNIRVIK